MTMQVMPHPMIPKAIDILMYVGGDNYTVPAYLSEAKQWGVSKRIPSGSIPDGLIPGVSRIFLWHNEAIPLVRAEGKTMRDLTDLLVEKNLLDEQTATILELREPWKPEEHLLPSSYVPPHVLRLTCIIQLQEPHVRREIEKALEIEWQGGVIMWSYLGKPQYIVGKDGKVPTEIAQKYGDILEYVQVEYQEDDDDSNHKSFDEWESEHAL